MFEEIYNCISKEFSGSNAKEIIGGIANYHRIQSSPGFRQAAKYCYEKVVEYNIPQVKIHSYPANGNNQYWGCPVPKEWSIKSASLEIVEPKKNAKTLCRFFVEPCSIIQRSKNTPPEGLEAEVVILPRGLDENKMTKYNLQGKFVLTDDPDLEKIRQLVIKKFGAVGIIYDLVSELKPIRTRMNFPSARRYTSFWYGTKGDEGDALGFVLSAQQGDDLRNLIQNVENTNKKANKNEHVFLRAKIDSSFYDGEMEVVEFFIPGEKEGQEIIAVAHLCHPKPGAVDNASGCGTLLEVARTLQTLIKQGKLKSPKRGIRFLLMAEFTGTYCYLASNENKINSFIAGINLDMVGADQAVDKGRTLILERTHNACPSFVNDVLSAILNNAANQIPNFLDSASFATFKYSSDQPFSGGSDHAIFCHPDIGVGMPMFIQWPDRYYHTEEDSIEKVSEEMLDLIGTMTATYCYFIASATLPDIIWIVGETTTKGKERLTSYARKLINHTLLKAKVKSEFTKLERENMEKDEVNLIEEFIKKLETKMKFRRDIELQTLDSIQKLCNNNEDKGKLEELIMEMKNSIANHTEKEIIQIKLILEKITQAMELKSKQRQTTKKTAQEITEGNLIPSRICKGPLSGLNLNDLNYEDILEKQKIENEYKGMGPVLSTAFYYIDGKRTIAEVSELVECDIGKTNQHYLAKMLRFLEKFGLIKIK